MVFLYIIAAALMILLINGLVQQERIRLWKHEQELTAEKARLAIEESKKEATERVRSMLRERRQEATGSDQLRTDGPVPAESPAAATVATSDASESAPAAAKARTKADGAAKSAKPKGKPPRTAPPPTPPSAN
jgi:hypothetical protein